MITYRDLTISAACVEVLESAVSRLIGRRTGRVGGSQLDAEGRRRTGTAELAGIESGSRAGTVHCAACRRAGVEEGRTVSAEGVPARLGVGVGDRSR